jgi:transposase-like protein
MVVSAETADFFCPNEKCPDHGKRGIGNITLYNRYGRDHRRLLKCRTCNFKFSERRNTFFFGLHTEESKIKEVIMYLLDGKSFREAAVSAGIDKDTVLRIWKRFVAYCEESMDGLLKEFNIRLEDLITLLYQRRGHPKKPCSSAISGLRKGSETFWETLCGDEEIAPRKGLCSEHE